MKGKLKGLVLSNFLYLFLFYIIYFIIVPTALYIKGITCGLDIFTVYCDQIPDSTVNFMNFLLFVIIPVSAAIVTIISSREPQYTYTG